MALQSRPPIVAIMGHVDHGKTSLLDYIRKSRVASSEAGGITQHIGAYQAVFSGKQITFLDTPGHAAFSKMRSRGATVTDIVILVVSAVEGVKPQTVESIQHIKSAGVQYLVAATKTDLPDSNPELVKAQLTEHEVFVQGYGGEIEFVPVSAKTGEGVDKLLETILVMADLAELSADPEAPLAAVIIEAEKSAKSGVTASVLVQQGTLHRQDDIEAQLGPEQGFVAGRVRQMKDATGSIVESAGPSVPVEVMGWIDLPEVGAIVQPKGSYAHARQTPSSMVPGISIPSNRVRLLLKADTQGTLEAFISSIKVDEVEIVDANVGEVNEADVLLAESTGARILGFHVKVPKDVEDLAKSLKVKVKTDRVIYRLIEEIQKQVLKLIEPTIDEVELGRAEIVMIFEMKGEKIAGCRVVSGELSRGKNYHLYRENQIVENPRIKSMKNGKLDVEVVKTGAECGIVFRQFQNFQVGDVLTSYIPEDEA